MDVSRKTTIPSIFIYQIILKSMYFLYVDGSGQTAIKHSSDNNGLYILSGVIVHERDWKKIENDLNTLKKEIFPELDPESWELHASAIWNNRDFFTEEKLKLNFAKKQEIFSKVLDLICNSEITLINIIIFKDLMKDRYPAPQPMEYSWTFLVERFEHFLKQHQEEPNNGLLFVDSSQKIPESEIKNVVWRLVRNGSYWQRVEYVIEDPIFTKSHLRNLIQLADMIAYVIHKHYRHDLQFKDWFEGLKPKMYQHDKRLHGFGIKEFPK